MLALLINHMNKKIIILSALSGLSVPLISFALSIPGVPTGITFTPGCLIENLLNFAWPVVVAVVIVFFIITGIMFLSAQGNETQIATARTAMIWGVGGVVVIILSFGIISVVSYGLSGGGVSSVAQLCQPLGACKNSAGACVISTKLQCMGDPTATPPVLPSAGIAGGLYQGDNVGCF